jgi:predicted TIM-barrel fold metal-dependent hydrolase
MLPIIDTHLHLVYKDRFSYPWLANVPAIDRQWTAESYFAAAEPLGIEQALHMEVDAAEADMLAETEFMAGVHPGVIGAIAGCRPEYDDFAEQLETLAALPHVRGLRRILHQAPDDLSQKPVFADNLNLLPRYGFTFDLCLRADQLHLGAALAEKCPDVQFVLDHCGNPDIANNGFTPWALAIAELARHANVAVKISGIVTNARPGWRTADLKPYFEHLVQSFGWERMVWGSDHPVLTQNGTLAQWVAATRELIAGASAGEQEKLLSGNARRLYRLERKGV